MRDEPRTVFITVICHLDVAVRVGNKSLFDKCKVSDACDTNIMFAKIEQALEERRTRGHPKGREL